MSSSALVASGVGAAVVLAASPALARLSLDVPDSGNATWWKITRATVAATPRWRLWAAAGLALLFGTLGGRAAHWSALLPAWLVLAVAAVPLVIIDFEHHRLPDRLTYPSAALGAVLLAFAAADEHAWSAFGRAAGAAAVVLVVFFALAVIAPFGLGDVKYGAVLAGYLGWFGWGHVLYGILAGFVVATVASTPFLLSGRAGMKTAVPLGPALALGAFLVAAFDLVPGYLR